MESGRDEPPLELNKRAVADLADDRIKDLPRHREALQDADGMLALARVAKALQPFLPQRARDALSSLDPKHVASLRSEMAALAELPDRFNDHFAPRGWIAFDLMNVDVMRTAVTLADAGRVEEAEDVLVAYWSAENIRFHITQLKRVEAFRSRWQLAVDAEALYKDEMYHACTLLVLAAMDGMVQEVRARYLGINQNFSAEKTELEAWDSIAGHSSGLKRLKELILSPRKKTNTEPLRIPYRHGIVHGMDVNFNHKIVAAKAWATLFSVGEWAHRAQQKSLKEPPPVAKKTPLQELRDAAQTVEKTARLKKALQEFRPRTAWVDGKIPATGRPEDYEANTPERALVTFLDAWRSNNYGRMASLLTTIGKPPHPGDIRDAFSNLELMSFNILEVADKNIARAEIGVRIRVRRKRPDTEWESELKVIMTRKLEDATPELLRETPWTFFDYYSFVRPPKA